MTRKWHLPSMSSALLKVYMILSVHSFCLSVCVDTLEGGHNIEEFISHGLELLSYLLPPSVSPDDLK